MGTHTRLHARPPPLRGCVGQKLTLYLLIPPPAALQCTHNKRAPQEVPYVQLRCGSLSAALWHTHASDGKQLHQTWTDATGWLLATSKQIYIAALLPSPLSPPLQHLMLLLHFSSWAFPCFKRLLIFPWLLFNLMFVVFLLFSVTKFGEKALLDSFGWCMQPHTWHTLPTAVIQDI